MAWDAIVHDALWKEVPVASHDELRLAMRALTRLSEPSRSPSVKAIEGSAYDKSYRLRVGRYRILVILFPDAKTLVFTTAFAKKRESDYAQAVARHDARIRTYE